MPGQPIWMSYAITFGIIALIIGLRWRRLSRSQPLRLERLWIVPTVYAAVAVAAFAAHPPAPLGWLFVAAALVLGGALGWQRGKLMRIEIDPVTHALNQRGSPAAMLLLVAIVVARLGARRLAEVGGFAIDPLAVTDVLIAFALGLFAATRTEMYLRARRLLTAARQGSA